MGRRPRSLNCSLRRPLLASRLSRGRDSARDSAEADAVVAEVEAGGYRAIAVQADVSQSADVARMFDQAEQAFGGIDVLVNNAGVMTPKPLADIEDEIFDRTFAINVRGTFNTLKQAARTATDLFFEGKSEAVIQQFTKMAPLERLGQRNDIASVAAFLVGPDAAWINGQTIRAYGVVV
jgi:NAD(P)-dependent dehydrogenase (short-subunit alcohol dehydrogenase family)